MSRRSRPTSRTSEAAEAFEHFVRQYGKIRARQLEDRKKLESLRLGVQRIAELTRSGDVAQFIPPQGAELGWNRLCAVLCDWVEQHR